ncbi:hypothetical protein BKA62DRAFT_679433 [Auriculariales sp. MPI-PUGE-AT-0066]|nr:hypothetical protein BKA62DRAFT_679433 [Auriculariales sp. MPI-PUGE-AT-0066]
MSGWNAIPPSPAIDSSHWALGLGTSGAGRMTIEQTRISQHWRGEADPKNEDQYALGIMLRSDDGDELGDELDDELQPLSPDPVQLRFHHGFVHREETTTGLRLHVADALPQVNAAALDVRLRQGQNNIATDEINKQIWCMVRSIMGQIDRVEKQVEYSPNTGRRATAFSSQRFQSCVVTSERWEMQGVSVQCLTDAVRCVKSESPSIEPEALGCLHGLDFISEHRFNSGLAQNTTGALRGPTSSSNLISNLEQGHGLTFITASRSVASTQVLLKIRLVRHEDRHLASNLEKYGIPSNYAEPDPRQSSPVDPDTKNLWGALILEWACFERLDLERTYSSYTMGRATDPIAHHHLDTTYLGMYHCVITWDLPNDANTSNIVLLEDLDTLNGVWVNGKRMPKRSTCYLKDGDRISLSCPASKICFLYRHYGGSMTVTDKYTFGETLGSGTYGVVKTAFSKADGTTYAVKVIFSQHEEPEIGKRHHVEHEVNVMKQINHPNVVAFIELFVDTEADYIVMEHLEGGDLLNFMLELDRTQRRLGASVSFSWNIEPD